MKIALSFETVIVPGLDSRGQAHKLIDQIRARKLLSNKSLWVANDRQGKYYIYYIDEEQNNSFMNNPGPYIFDTETLND